MRDAARTLARCLAALEAQDLPRGGFEVLVVDNNSTDDSIAIAEGFDAVRVLRETEQGAYAARNRGLREARGHVVAFTDPDCVPDPDWLRELTAPLEDPTVQVVLGRTRFARCGPLLDLLETYERARAELLFAGDDAQLYYGRNNNMAFRAPVFDEIGLFDLRARGGDTIQARRIVDRHGCDAMVYRPSAVVRHLEIGSALDHLRKVRIYATSFASYGAVVEVAVPGPELNRAIRERAARDGALGPLRRALLRALLAAQGAAWSSGLADARSPASRKESA